MNSPRDWKAYETGYRTKIISELHHIRHLYEDHFKSLLKRDTQLFQLAYQALLFKTSWIEDFIRYIDEVYEDYPESRFDAKRAWNITTRLAMTLLEYLAAPRSGVKNSLTHKYRDHMRLSTFFASVQSFDTMKEIHKDGFKNSPIVANELVKVLDKNTQFDAIKNLKCEVTDLNGRQSETKKRVTEASSLINAANNKSDGVVKDLSNLKSEPSILTKRV